MAHERRSLLGVFAGSILVALVLVVGADTAFVVEDSLTRMTAVEPAWLVAGVLAEVAFLAGHAALTAHIAGGRHRASIIAVVAQITLARPRPRRTSRAPLSSAQSGAGGEHAGAARGHLSEAIVQAREPDHHALAISKGAPHGRAGIGFEIDGSLDDAQRALDEAGVEAERRSDPEAGIADALVLAEPLTDTPVTLYEAQAASGVRVELGLRPTKLGHIAGYVPELTPVQAFWEGTLGFRFSDQIGDFFLFLRCNADHHAVNLMASQKRSGLHHCAFEVRDLMHLSVMLDHLARHEVRLEWGPGRHGVGHNIFSYHHDPDGNVVELFTDLDGASSAPNTPCSARAPTNIAKDCEKPPRADASAKPTSPPMKVHLRPKRSPKRPPSSSRLPKESAYAVMIHWRSSSEKPSDRCAEGSAILTMVASSTTMS